MASVGHARVVLLLANERPSHLRVTCIYRYVTQPPLQSNERESCATVYATVESALQAGNVSAIRTYVSASTKWLLLSNQQTAICYIWFSQSLT